MPSPHELMHPPQTDVVVLVSANVEWRAIEQIFPDVEARQSPFGKWFVTALGSEARPVLLFHGGWGKIAAAASTQYVLQHAVPMLLVNLGTCGGFRGRVDAGAVILVERALVYDIEEQMGDQAEHIAHYTTEIDLDWLAQPYPHKVIRSLIVSGDRDLRVDETARLVREFGAIVGDWESASIAWVAGRNGVRTLILRGVSDLVDHERGEAYDGNLHVFEQNTAAIMKMLIAQLPDWIDAARAK